MRSYTLEKSSYSTGMTGYTLNTLAPLQIHTVVGVTET